jgi:predicted small lipoprotein YifL
MTDRLDPRSGRLARAVLVAVALALGVTACGKKGTIEPPPGAELYKRGYPAPESVRREDARE